MLDDPLLGRARNQEPVIFVEYVARRDALVTVTVAHGASSMGCAEGLNVNLIRQIGGEGSWPFHVANLGSDPYFVLGRLLLFGVIAAGPGQ